MKNRLLSAFAALASAALLASLWAPFNQSAAVWFALVPLLLLIRRSSPRAAFGWGWLCGFITWCVQLGWMLRLTANGGPWPLVVPALAGLSAVLALFIGAFAATAARLRQKLPPRWVLLSTVLLEPMLWAGAEILRSKIFTGFAWNPLGLACSDFLPVMQLASVGGVTLVSALAASVNGAVATLCERCWLGVTGRLPSDWRGRLLLSAESLLPLALLLAAFLWGLGRMKDYERAEKSVAAIVCEATQVPCIFTGEKVPPMWASENAQKAELLAMLPQKPDLWLWPESSAVGWIFPLHGEPQARLGSLSRKAGVPLLVGGLYFKRAGGQQDENYNAALLFTGNGLDSRQVYGKRHLVPFGEYIPGDTLFPALQRFAPTGVSNTPGREVAAVRLPSGLVVGPLICFEDTVCDVARESVLAGAQVLVNMSNDAWYAPSAEGAQHARHALLRAIECGVPIIRSTNGGQNAAFDALGRPLDVEAFPTRLPVGAQPFAGAYLRWGDVTFGAWCVLLLLGVWLARFACRLRRKLCLALALLAVGSLSAAEPLLPTAEMAMDDGNISLAERTAKSLLATLGISPEERIKAEEVLIRAHLAKGEWAEALARVEATPELPASHRLAFQLAAYNGRGDYAKTLEAYAQAAVGTDDGWGVAALRMVLQAELELGKHLPAADHFAAVDQAKGADARIRAENALLWASRFPNATSRVALLRAAEAADRGGVYLSCALALPKAFAQADNRAQAVACLDRLLALKGLTSVIEARLALAAAELDTEREAKLAHARRALSAAREEATRRTALALLGKLLCEEEATRAEGLQLLDEAIRLNPSAAEVPELLLFSAETLQRAGSQAEALKAYDQYLSGYDLPEFRARVRQGKARTLLQLDRPDEALAAFTEAADFESSPDRRQGLILEAAEAAMAAKRPARAAALYRSLDSADPAIRLRLARALEAEGKAAEALKAYAEVRDLPDVLPEDAFVASERLGALLCAEGRQIDAVAEYSRALGRLQEPKFQEPLRATRARTYYALGQLDKARDDFALLQEAADPDCAAEARFFLVLCLYGLGEDERARELASAYVAAYPDSPRIPDVLLWLAKSDFNRGSYAAAAKGFLDFTRRWPKDARVPQALLLAARAAYQDSDYAQCVELVGRLAKEFPRAPLLPDARFLQAEALMELARHAEARDLLDALIRTAPTAPWIGEAYGRRGDCLLLTATDDPARYALALEAYREALAHLESDPDAVLAYQYKIGRIFEKQLRRDDAAAQYAKLAYRVLSRPEIYSDQGLRHLQKALIQLRAIEFARGNRSGYETLLRRLRHAKLVD